MKDHYGFKTRRSLSQIEEMRDFKDDLIKLIKNIKFRKVNDPFQDKLRKEIKSVRDSNDIIVKADKTRSMYMVTKDQYCKQMHDNVTRNYGQAPNNTYAEINSEAKRIAKDLKIGDRIDTMAKAEAFITLKDYKERFPSDLPCGLINPAKSELGMVSKIILEKITNAVCTATGVRLWRNTQAIINWFNGTHVKEKCMFV